MKKKITLLKKGIILFLILACITGMFICISNVTMMVHQGKKILSVETASQQDAQCILILGCGVWNGNTPSPMLKDRLNKGIELYEAGVAPKILVSGDHGQVDYDEVNVMKNYLMEAGISDDDIFMDHAGFSTYESIVRAKKIFQIERMVIVTQEYHQYRALYISERYGIQATGVNADARKYRGALYRNIREWIARDKDILSCLLRIKPTYLGETIDISGSGSVTND